MSERDPLLIEMGITLAKLNKELARAEFATLKATRKMEKGWNDANNKGAQSFKKIDAAVARTSANIGGLGRVLLGAFSVREIQRFADEWTVAGNKIAAASELTGTQARSLSALNDIAAETRSGISETVDLYAKLLRATKGVAKSEEEVARATAIVNKAFKAGGAAASEQAAGILQLAQGLSSGVLQGDELRSIRENAPLIAQAIADEFKTTIGGLKELGADGELTARRVFSAILKAQEPIEAAFSKTNATIGESFTLLRNSISEYIGDADKATGASAKISAALVGLAGNIDLLIAAGGILAGRFVGPVLLGMFVRVVPILRSAALAISGIGSAAGASAAGLVALRGAMALLGGPFGIIIGALTLLPALTESSAEKTARFKAAADDARTALVAYADASKRAADEQDGLEGKVSATTRALVAQTREAVQASLRELEKLREESIADLLGDGLFDRSQLAPAQSRIKLQIDIDRRSGDANRFLDELNAELKKLEKRDLSGISGLRKQMDLLAGVGDEVNTVLRIFDQALEGTASEMKDAGVPLVDLAKQLGLFEKEIKAVEAAQTEFDIKQAYIDLRAALIEAKEASETLRTSAVADARELISSYDTLNGKVDALTGSLVNVSQAQVDAFDGITKGANAAGISVDALNAKILAAQGQYVRSRAISDRSTNGQAEADASKKGLRDLIGYAEGTDKGRGYNETLAYGKFTGGDVVLVNKTLNEILAIQKKMLEHPENNFNSSAVGRYQIIRTTLKDIMKEMGLSGNELFSESMQDRMADNRIDTRGRDVPGLRNEWEGLRNIDPANITQAFDNSAGPRAEASSEATKKQNDELAKQQELRVGLLARAQESLSATEMEIGLIGRNIAEQVRLRTETELLNEAKRLGIDVDKELTASGKTYREEIKALASATGELAAQEKVRLDELGKIKDAQGALDAQATNLKNTFLDVATGITSAADAAKNLAQQLARAYLEAAFFNSGPFASGGGGGGGGIFSFFKGILGYSEGGYTGGGGKMEPKGVVHGGEYVFSKEAVNRIGVPKLDAMHKNLKGFANGGFVGSSAKSPLAAPDVNVAAPNVMVYFEGFEERVSEFLTSNEGEMVLARINARNGGGPNA